MDAHSDDTQACHVVNKTGIKGLACHILCGGKAGKTVTLCDDSQPTQVELERSGPWALELQWYPGGLMVVPSFGHADWPVDSEEWYHQRYDIPVLPGGTYDVIVDPVDPPLTEADKMAIAGCLLDATEAGVFCDKEKWKIVCNRVFGGGRTPEVLESWCMNLDPKTDNGWISYYHPLTVAEGLSRREVASLIKQRPCRIEAYWRSLGDDSGQDTIRYRFDLGPRDTCLECHVFTWHYGVTFVTRLHKREIQADEIEDAVASVVKALEDEASGGLNVELPVFDWDLGWHSAEVLAYVPLPWTPQNHGRLPEETRKTIKTFALANARPDKERPRLSQDLIHMVFEALVPVVEWKLVYRLHQSLVTQCVRGQREIMRITESIKTVFQKMSQLVDIGPQDRWDPWCPVELLKSKTDCGFTPWHPHYIRFC